VLPSCGTVGRLLDALPATDGEILRDLLGLAEIGIVTLEEPHSLIRVVTDGAALFQPTDDELPLVAPLSTDLDDIAEVA
jgi:hypothetical protein